MRPEPSERIDPNALTVWRITGSVTSLIVWLIVLGLAAVTAKFGWVWAIPAGAGACALVYSVLQIVVIPAVRWRRWRYAINESEIDLKHGVFVVKRTLIPMVRVQHVDTTQGPLLRRYNLASVAISTAAGQHEIPALVEETADALRDRIAELAQVTDDV